MNDTNDNTRTAGARRARVDAIHETRERMERERREREVARRRHEKAYALHKARLAERRAATEGSAGNSPWERAVRRVERVTGVPREQWEDDITHRYNHLATQAALVLAGIAA